MINKDRYCILCGVNHTGGNWCRYGNGYICRNCKNKLRSKARHGTLSKHSETGKGLITEQVVAKYLGIENLNIKLDKFARNPIDMFDNKLGRIDVKSCRLIEFKSKFSLNYGWHFNDIIDYKYVDTYILVGFDENRKNIIKVWIISSKSFDVKTGIGIRMNTLRNGFKSKYKKYEIDAKPFNDILHELSKLDCPYLCDVGINKVNINEIKDNDFEIITGR